MKRTCFVLGIVAVLAMAGAVFGVAQTNARGFGFGGPMAMAFFPNMTGINTFLSESGLPAIGDVLFGAGGNGRGGVIPGPVFGGVGWGLVAESQGQDRSAELIIGNGGMDVGVAVGGDDQSVLTFGAVLGGGANILTVKNPLTEPDGWAPAGIVPGPVERELLHVGGFVQPYVSLAAQILPWMGFELRIGYVLPVFGVSLGDDLGIPAPSLDLSGPTVSFGILFGGIGSSGTKPTPGLEKAIESRSGSIPIAADEQLMLENTAGDITISSYAADTTQTGPLLIEWQAMRTTQRSARTSDRLQVIATPTDDGATIASDGSGRIDYVLRIPSGIDLHIKNGQGNITLVGHDALTIIIESAAGDTIVHDVDAAALIVTAGLGNIDLYHINVQSLIANLGIGKISLGLPPSASTTILAHAGLGDVSIDRFPSMIGGVHGLLGKSANITLGRGEQSTELRTGIGQINIGVRMD